MQGNNKIGRPKGSKSVDSLAYQEFFVKKKVCIPEHELWVLKQAKKQYQLYARKLNSGSLSPMEDNASKYLKIYQDQIREIANRIYPKLKSIEHQAPNPLDGKTVNEKIEILDHLKKVLLEELNGSR